MRRECISKDWYLKAPREKTFKKVDLPHDYAITGERNPDMWGGANTGYYEGGIGTYVKYIKLDETPKHYILDIDGAYMCATVRMNDDIMIMHPHGYTPLLVDLTRKAVPGETNKITISTNAIQPSSRWYSGAGVYRDVYLWSGGDIRVEPRDVFITTPDLEGNVNAAVTVTADKRANVTLRAYVTDAEGNTVCSESRDIALKAGKNETGIDLKINSPKLWDTENPYLYTLHTEITHRGEVVDTTENRFGVRTIAFDTKHGFRLNGKSMKLRGGCIHHDHGVLGAADFPAACKRKLTLLKDAGFNSLRIAHNPPSLTLLEYCDEMGILVMDEAFDMWREPHGVAPLSYAMWFADWCLRDISYMVLRDRNHPSVITYSIGNEIGERSGVSDGAGVAKALTDEIKKYDTTRPVTTAICGIWDISLPIDPPEYKAMKNKGFKDIGNGDVDSSFADRAAGYLAPVDIVGYNYLHRRYAFDKEAFPSRVLWGSETQAMEFYDSWTRTLENDNVIGDYTWTAYDNLGEAGCGKGAWARDEIITGISTLEYPWRTCFQGDLDLCGYRRPQSYFREAVWIGNTEPKIFTSHPKHFGEGYTGTGWHWYDVLDTWTYPEEYIGSPVECQVYTDADEIEWFLNGKSVCKSKPEKAIARAAINYAPGELSVVAYKKGKKCGESSLKTVGAPAKLMIIPETEEIKADNRDLAYFRIIVTDKDGNRVPDANVEIRCRYMVGEFMGVFSGCPNNEDKYGSPVCHTFEGRALAIMRTKVAAGMTLIVESEGLEGAFAKIRGVN